LNQLKFKDRKVKRFNAEGTEVGTQRARRDRDCAVIAAVDWDALTRTPTLKRREAGKHRQECVCYLKAD
jgi:hypothetical protein